MSILLGLGFGLPCVFGIRNFARTDEVWTFMGFPTYGHGPFERIGIQTSVPLLLGFLVLCAAEVVVGVMILAGTPYASAMSCLKRRISDIVYRQLVADAQRAELAS